MRNKILKLIQYFLIITGGLIIVYGTVGAISTIKVPRGGTGQNEFESGAFLVGAGTSAIGTSTNLVEYNNKIGVGTSTPAYTLDVYGNIRADGDVRTTGTFYGDTWSSITGNSMNIKPSGDEDDFFSFKTIANRPTWKREGGKFIYCESSNVYDVGISFRDDDTYSGTLNYEKDGHMMTMLGKASPLGFKANSDYDDYIKIQTASNIPEITVASSSALKINAGGTNALLLNHSGGNVGIGTSSPNYILDVYGNARIDGTATTTNLTVIGNTKAGTIISGTWNGTALADAYVANDITASNYLPLAGGTMTNTLTIDQNANSQSINIDSEATSATVLNIDAVNTSGNIVNVDDKFVVDYVGDIGIGVTSSQNILHINADFAGGVTTGLTDAGIVFSDTSNGVVQSGIFPSVNSRDIDFRCGDTFRFFGNPAAVGYEWRAYNSGNTFFGGLRHDTTAVVIRSLSDDVSEPTAKRIRFTFQNKGGSEEEKITILRNGNMGIGTTSPFQELSVSGDGVFTGSVTGWNLYTEDNLFHVGDDDTYVHFPANDQVSMVAGGEVVFLSTDAVTTFNSNESASIDFKVSGGGDANLLVADAGIDRVGIGTSTPAMKFSVHGDALADSWNVYSNIYQGEALSKLKNIKAEKDEKGDWAKVDHDTLPEGVVSHTQMDGYVLPTMSIDALAQMNTKAVQELYEINVSQTERIEELEANIVKIYDMLYNNCICEFPKK